MYTINTVSTETQKNEIQPYEGGGDHN